MQLNAFQKHEVAQMTGLSREQVEDVVEAINHVTESTPAFAIPEYPSSKRGALRRWYPRLLSPSHSRSFYD